MPVVHTGSVAIPKPWVAQALMEWTPDDQLYAADKVLPKIGVQVQSGTLPIVQREDMLRIENTQLAPGATYGRVDFREEGLQFRCVKNGLEAQITDEDRAIYKTAFDVELVKAKQVSTMMAIKREARAAAAIFSAAWTGGGATLYTDVTAAPWTTAASDPFTQIEAAVEHVRLNSGMLPNALIMNTTNLGRLLFNTVIRARYPGAAIITRDMLKDTLAQLFGINTIIECGAVYSSAAEGAAFVGANIWSNLYCGVARVCTSEDPSEPGLGRTLRWDALDGGETDVDVTLYREEQTDSDVLKVKNYLDELILGTAYMHLLKVAAS